MIVTTSILNNADNKNIKVSNGRIVDNGVGSIIIALSSPGLYESLNFDNLKDMDKVEISYETNNFTKLYEFKEKIKEKLISEEIKLESLNKELHNIIYK